MERHILSDFCCVYRWFVDQLDEILGSRFCERPKRLNKAVVREVSNVHFTVLEDSWPIRPQISFGPRYLLSWNADWVKFCWLHQEHLDLYLHCASEQKSHINYVNSVHLVISSPIHRVKYHSLSETQPYPLNFSTLIVDVPQIRNLVHIFS